VSEHADRIRKAKDRIEREADELVTVAMSVGGMAALTQLSRVRDAVSELANAEAWARSKEEAVRR
jgi:chemotaxis response regulator CheB